MKKIIKRSLLFSAAFCCLAGVSMLNDNVTAKAEVSTASSNEFFVEGAAVRLTDELANNGISFHTILNTSSAIYTKFTTNGVLKDGVTTGTIIAPAKLVSTEGLTKDTVLSGENEIVDINTTNIWKDYALNDTQYKKTVAYIYDIPEEYYTVDLVAAGYITDGTDTVYTAKSAPFSMSWVAKTEYDDANSKLDATQKEDLKDTYIGEYTVSYHDGETSTSEQVLYGDKITAEQPETAGKYFVGYTNKTGTAVWNKDENVVISNTNLYVNWADYNFNSLTDLDKNTVGLLNVSSSELKIVADENATDGFAIRALTTVNANGSGMVVNFNNVDISEYSQIIVRVRQSTANSIGVYVNDVASSVAWKPFNTYTTLDILPALKANNQNALNKITLMAKSVGGAEIFLDNITFVKGSITYDFSSVDDAVDFGIVSAVNGAYGLAIATFEGTEDGYAVKASSSTLTGSGLKFSFNGLDLRNYQSIIIRAQVVNQFFIAVNGVDITERGNHVSTTSYSELDLLELINAYNAGKTGSEKITKLDSFTIHRNYATMIYVDSITFVEGVVETKPQNIVTLTSAAATNTTTLNSIEMPDGLKDDTHLGCDVAKLTFSAKWSSITLSLTETVSVGMKVYVSIYAETAMEIGFKFAQDSASDMIADSYNVSLIQGWNLVEIGTSSLSNLNSAKTAINYIFLQQRTANGVVYLESVYVK